MRALLGAKELSDRNGWRFSYTWDDHSAGLSAKLEELWEHDFVRSSRVAAVMRTLPKREFLSGDVRSWPSDSETRRRIDVKTGDYIIDRSGDRLDWGRRLRMLRTSDAVARRITEMSTGLGQGAFVGVMIRAHEASHPKTKEFSPVRWYEQRMRELLDQRADLRFYISCDVPEVAAALVAKFPSAVTQHNKGGYNTTTGTQAAVADIYMLASAGGVLRPYWSSFTTMASELSDHVVMLEDSQSELSLTASSLVARAPNPLRPWVRLGG